jgi:intron-binding protein aquarius
MPPKRKSKRSTTPAKAPAAAAKRTKKQSGPTVDNLVTACLGETASARSLQQAQDQSHRQAILWPELRAEFAKGKKRNEKRWFTLCHLGAALLSWEFRDGSPKHNMAAELVLAGTDDCVTQWLTTLCESTHPQDPSFPTTVTHLLDLLWAVVPPSCGGLYPALLAQLGGPTLAHFWPTRRKELEERKGKFPFSEDEAPTQKPYVLRMIDSLLQVLEEKTQDDDMDENTPDEKGAASTADDATLLYVHRCLELLIDLLSTWKTRMYLVPYLEATHFYLRATRSALVSQDVLAGQLLDGLHALLTFPLYPYTGEPQTKAECLALYHQRASTLQKMAHRHFAETLPDVIYAGVGILCQDDKFLGRALAGLTQVELHDFLYKMRLVETTDPETYDRSFLMAVLEAYLIIPADPTEELRTYPLYPTEQVLWDVNRIPPSRRLKESNSSPVLALPKLQRNFLSFADYLVRNFTLTSLETAYSIRRDLVDIIRRLNPVLRQNMNDNAEDAAAVTVTTEFSGWARMALELASPVEITKVEKPLLGTTHPASVQALVMVDLKLCADSLRQEWDALSEYDNLFLVTINAEKMTSAPASQDGGKAIADADDPAFPQRFGVTAVRGCMITQVRDGDDTVVSDMGAAAPTGTKRTFRVVLDPNQYAMDAKSPAGTDVYQSFNLVVRRRGRENNFRAILETTRGLLTGNSSISRVLPPWLQTMLLGHGDPADASYESEIVRKYAKETVGVADPDSFLDFGDTFIDEEHLRASFPGAKMTVDGRAKLGKKSSERVNYKVRVQTPKKKQTVDATSYPFPGKGNSVRFTPVQVGAIRSGLSCGMTMVVGPPGTGKTDVAVQVIACLYHSYPTQRTIVVTHSNAALNDIFSKVMTRGDVDERYMVRLGSGERDLETDSTHDFTKSGRVAYSMERRSQLLEQVQQISESLGLSGRAERGEDGSPSYTCETSAIFFDNQIKRKLRTFRQKAKEQELTETDSDVSALFPFLKYFKETTVAWSRSEELIRTLSTMFDELAEYRPLELLRSQRQKTDYLLIKQARIVAMTCTHAAIARSHLLSLGFEYDNLVIEESGQMTEVDTIVPFLLQKSESDSSSAGLSRLKRVCLMGDHNQLPPVIQNQTFSRYSNLDQSLFARLIGFGVPHILLDQQGRARSELAQFYSWRYNGLGNLDHVNALPAFRGANAGFVHTFQFIDVGEYKGKGEMTPTAFYYQNMGEAEYLVGLFMYMVLIGYEPSKISILATYNGQVDLLRDIIAERCGAGTPLEGIRPAAVATVDQYQGQQNDYILLSLVRTEGLGHLRDIRRWVVGLSRARLGLYMVGRSELFKPVHELQPIVNLWEERPQQLELLVGETVPTERQTVDALPEDQEVFRVESVEQLGAMVYQLQEQLLQDGGEEEEDTTPA